MDAIVDTVGALLLGGLLVWYLGGWLLRLAAASCFICAAGLLALGDVTSGAGVAGCGLVSWAVAQILWRGRHGWWRSPRAARLAGAVRRAPSR